MSSAEESGQVKLRKGLPKRGIFAALLLVLASLLLFWWNQSWVQSESELAKVAALPKEGPSNVRASDYVGPKECAPCHEARYLEWSSNLHRKMNRLVSEPGAVLGNFSDQRIPYGPGALLLDRSGLKYIMSFEEAGKVVRRFSVTRTIGSRYLQEYVGIQSEGPEPLGHSVYSTEIRLPFGYLIGMKRWVHQQYFDSWHDR